MSAKPIYTRADFDRDRPTLEALLKAWSEREATSFDDAVDGKPTLSSLDDNDCTIWDDMPAIDSKRSVGALVELEKVVGHKLPISLIRPGGYDSADDLTADLLPKVRETCVEPDVTTTAVAAAPPGVATSVRLQAHP